MAQNMDNNSVMRASDHKMSDLKISQRTEGKTRGAYSLIVAGLALSLMLNSAPANAAAQSSSQQQDQPQSQDQSQAQPQSQDQNQQPQANQPSQDQQQPPADRSQAPQEAPPPPPVKAKPKYVPQDANRPPYVNDREQEGNSPYSAPPPSAQDDRMGQDDRGMQDDQGDQDQPDGQQPPYDRDTRDRDQRDSGQQAPDDRQAPPPPYRNRASRPAQRDYSNRQPAQPSAPLPAALTIPAGTVLSVRMNEFVSSDKNQIGDRITATLERPIVVNGWVVARRGETVSGQVTAAVKAGRIKGTSQLGLELTDLTIVDGSAAPILTEIWKGSGGTTHGADAAAIGGTTALGAAIGSVADWGRGAAIGAGAGAAAGIGAVLLTRGRPTELLPETPLTFRLVDPVTVDTTKSAQAFAPVTQQDYDGGRGERHGRRYAGYGGYPPPPAYGPYYAYPAYGYPAYPYYAYPYPYGGFYYGRGWGHRGWWR